MLSIFEILEELKEGIELFPVELRAVEINPLIEESVEADALAEIKTKLGTFKFVVEAKSRNTPSVFEGALNQVRKLATKSKCLPLLLMPYLNESQLKRLEEERISGVDLSGNGIISVPDQLLIYRSGNRNKYPDSQPTKYAYRGTTSLVARVFLLRTEFESLADIEQEIEARGSSVALSTISKALKRLESDLIVSRSSSMISLQQADKLLDQLASSFTMPKINRSQGFSLEGELKKFFAALGDKQNVVLNGQSSVSKYAVMGSNECPVLYCSSIDRLLKSKVGSRMKKTSRFVDIELQETKEPTVYFDRRLLEGISYASPIQTFLELNAGDKRQQEAALQVRKAVLSPIENY